MRVLTVSSSSVLPLLVTYVTVLPKRYRRGPLVSLSVSTLPGVYSVIMPSLSVVVVVVVVLEVCPQANGATTASAMLSSVFFIVILPIGFHGPDACFPPHSRRARVSPCQYC